MRTEFFLKILEYGNSLFCMGYTKNVRIYQYSCFPKIAGICDGFRCDGGKCLPAKSKCNMLRECSDGEDEANCTCADFLRAQSLDKKICDGVVDCWDYSDESNCGKFLYPKLLKLLILN